MDLDLSKSDATQFELTLEGEVVDIFAIHEKTKYVFTGVIRDDDGKILDPATWALFFAVYEKQGGALVFSRDTDSGIVTATNQFTMTILDTNVSVSTDIIVGESELVMHDGGSLSGEVTGRVQGSAIVKEVNKE